MRYSLCLLFTILACSAMTQVSLDNMSATAILVERPLTAKYPLLVQSKAPIKSIMRHSSLQLPQGLHEHTAFFCRIEDAIAKQNKVNFKFRLGSVDYVDAMEGKGYFQAVSYSRASNFAMQYKQKN